MEPAGKPRADCPTCGDPFTVNRPQQRFCCVKCRNTFHLALTPQALQRQIEDLKAQLATIKAVNEAMRRHIEARDGVVIP